jgi:phosphatidate cytidylyltransferase
MNDFFNRSLVGLVYAGVWISAILVEHSLFYNVLVVSFAFIAAHEMLKLFKVQSILLPGLLCLITIGLFVNGLPLISVALIALLCQTALAVLMFGQIKIKLHPIFASLVCAMHILFPMLLLSESTQQESIIFTKDIVLGLLFFIWGTDGMAYSYGSMFGKNTLFRNVSPNKSIEGAVAALLFSPAVALVNSYLFLDYSFLFWLQIGLLASTTSIIGDLVQSQFKRTANVKDSGSILLGHGGLYDRLDSLIFAIPFVYLYILLFTIYVS